MTQEYLILNASMEGDKFTPLSPPINKKYQLSSGFTDTFFIMTIVIVGLLSSGLISLNALGGDQVSLVGC